MTPKEKAYKELLDTIQSLENDVLLINTYLDMNQCTSFYLDRLVWKAEIEERISILKESLQ